MRVCEIQLVCTTLTERLTLNIYFGVIFRTTN